MTPEQISNIISAMPEGKRKRACLSLMEVTGGYSNFMVDFWLMVDSSDWQGAAMFVLGLFDHPAEHKKATVEMYADMIWEGGS